MAFDYEKREALRLLKGIEDGGHKPFQLAELVKAADPTLVFLVFGWFRAWYPSSDPAADGVLGRLAEVCTRYPAAARRAKAGEGDPIVEWFLDEHSYRELRANEFIELVVEKLES
ncbi:MAG: hypothetical protein GY773_16210 [Actinomycetia bacterium]|nr:hypothetical protein [Actinomycetes bacterium]